MVRGKTNYTLSRSGYHLLIDEVPAWICQQCGEVYFEEEEVDAIQDLIKTLDSKIVKANLVKPT
jgi:YgiT-type zinc finger domain-containing protein